MAISKQSLMLSYDGVPRCPFKFFAGGTEYFIHAYYDLRNDEERYVILAERQAKFDTPIGKTLSAQELIALVKVMGGENFTRISK